MLRETAIVGSLMATPIAPWIIPVGIVVFIAVVWFNVKLKDKEMEESKKKLNRG